MFQSTHPRRVWPPLSLKFFMRFTFQSTHPRRVWPWRIPIHLGAHGFNPHTHEGCDDRVYDVKNPRTVSIHTPTKGVTFRFQYHQQHQNRFNPHTHEGCDPRESHRQLLSPCFNPHTHEGCDNISCNTKNKTSWFQSTHPRRVWLSATSSTRCEGCFNPHTHEGCDSQPLNITLSRYCFNPHTHEGCDRGGGLQADLQCVSIHTPTKGVTLGASRLSADSMFQSTHPRRVWLVIPNAITLNNKFQSTHPRRVWPSSRKRLGMSSTFQSTHPRRVWQDPAEKAAGSDKFQSTHPRRVWRISAHHKVLRVTVSIHTPTKGVTAHFLAMSSDTRVSIHTPTKGVTRQT